MSTMDYKGKTFIGFIDISGFSKLVEKDEQRAFDVLDQFYNSGFKTLGNRRNSDPIIKGTFVSDCGVLFARNKPDESNRIKALKKMLVIINAINKELIKDKIMLTSSIAYGSFKYQKRNIVLGKVDKSFIFGRPYLDAYKDNSKGKPKIRPGECRILTDNLPNDVKSYIDALINKKSDLFDKDLLDRDHYYYYWMCNNANLIENYRFKYDEIYKKIEQSNNDESVKDKSYNEIATLIKLYSSNNGANVDNLLTE